MTDLTFTRTINAPIAQVYRAFTNAMMARRWLCNNAHVNAAVNGAYLYEWNNEGYFAAGKFTALEENESVAFTWQGDGEPSASTVNVTLTEKDGKVTVKLVHSGIGDDWGDTPAQIKAGWESGLENLQSVLEDGLDLRIMRRPMMGVFFNPISEKDIEEYGLPLAVGEGVKLGAVLPDSGAEKAGLQTNDVISHIDGQVVASFPAYNTIVTKHTAGDTVPMVYYRDGKKHTGDLTFGQRPAPQVPDTPAEMAEAVETINDELFARMRELVDGVPFEVLRKSPAEGEWSVFENIAHLIWTERWIHMAAWGANGGNDNVPYPANDVIQTGTIADAYADVEAMLAAYEGCKRETVALIRNMPESLLGDRMSYLNLGQNFMNIHTHDRQHFAQIEATLEALGAAVAE